MQHHEWNSDNLRTKARTVCPLSPARSFAARADSTTTTCTTPPTLLTNRTSPALTFTRSTAALHRAASLEEDMKVSLASTFRRSFRGSSQMCHHQPKSTPDTTSKNCALLFFRATGSESSGDEQTKRLAARKTPFTTTAAAHVSATLSKYMSEGGARRGSSSHYTYSMEDHRTHNKFTRFTGHPPDSTSSSFSESCEAKMQERTAADSFASYPSDSHMAVLSASSIRNFQSAATSTTRSTQKLETAMEESERPVFGGRGDTPQKKQIIPRQPQQSQHQRQKENIQQIQDLREWPSPSSVSLMEKEPDTAPSRSPRGESCSYYTARAAASDCGLFSTRLPAVIFTDGDDDQCHPSDCIHCWVRKLPEWSAPAFSVVGLSPENTTLSPQPTTYPSNQDWNRKSTAIGNFCCTDAASGVLFFPGSASFAGPVDLVPPAKQETMATLFMGGTPDQPLPAPTLQCAFDTFSKSQHITITTTATEKTAKEIQTYSQEAAEQQHQQSHTRPAFRVTTTSPIREDDGGGNNTTGANNTNTGDESDDENNVDKEDEVTSLTPQKHHWAASLPLFSSQCFPLTTRDAFDDEETSDRITRTHHQLRNVPRLPSTTHCSSGLLSAPPQPSATKTEYFGGDSFVLGGVEHGMQVYNGNDCRRCVVFGSSPILYPKDHSPLVVQNYGEVPSTSSSSMSADSYAQSASQAKVLPCYVPSLSSSSCL